MKRLHIFIFITAFIISAMSTFAQGPVPRPQSDGPENEFTVDAQLRLRGEYQNGQGTLRSEGASPDGFISDRARLGLGYRHGGLTFKISGQHVGTWGSRSLTDTGDNGQFTLNEAWAQLESRNHQLYAKFGRQQLSYDDDRILGTLDWNQAGNFHDAMKVGYRGRGNKLDFIAAFNQTDQSKDGSIYFSGNAPYKTMQTLWYHYGEGRSSFQASVILMNLGQEGGSSPANTKTYYNQTIGTYITYRPLSDLTVNGTYYHQSGKTADGTKIDANMAAVKVDYTINPKWNVGVGYDWLQGEGNHANYDKTHAFNVLYGTHHKFYGTMDYFVGNYFRQGGLGLHDIQLNVGFKVNPRFDMSLAYHCFNSSDAVSNNGEKEHYLGSEIDWQFNWKVMKDVTLLGGYSVMCPTENMQLIKGGNYKSWQDWAWISINVSPRIFGIKW